MSGVFISYRRGQSGGYAGRLSDDLTRRFGRKRIFRDIEDISAGADFVRAIDTAVAMCDALIVVVTPGWAEVKDAEGHSRLDNPEDFVRLEIEAALRSDTWVIPVLVGGATMPSVADLPDSLAAFVRRQALEIRDTSWEFNVEQLAGTLERKGIKRASGRQLAKEGLLSSGKVTGRKIPRAVLGLGAVVAALIVLTVAQQAIQKGADRSDGGIDAGMNEPVDAGTSMPSNRDQRSRPPPEPLDKRGSEQPPVVIDEPPAVDRRSEELKLIQVALDMAVETEVAAYRNLDPAPLYSVYDGDILNQLLISLEQMAESGFYSVNTFYGRKIINIDISPDYTEAKVEMVETWSSEYYQGSSGACQIVPAHDFHQLLYLYRGKTGWMIEAVQHYSEPPPAVPC